MSSRRNLEPSPLEVADSTAGANAARDLDELTTLRRENAFLRGKLIVYEAAINGALGKLCDAVEATEREYND